MTKDNVLLGAYSGGSLFLNKVGDVSTNTFKWLGDLAHSADIAWLFIQKWGSAALFLLAIYKAFWPIIRPKLVRRGWIKPRKKSKLKDECDCEETK